MENEVENTVEDMQEDNNAIKQMRERIKELESVEKEFKSVQMANAIQEAGFDPQSYPSKNCSLLAVIHLLKLHIK